MCVFVLMWYVFVFLPEQIAAEDYAQHEDEHADAQYNDVHVERQTVDVFFWHVTVWMLQP